MLPEHGSYMLLLLKSKYLFYNACLAISLQLTVAMVTNHIDWVIHVISHSYIAIGYSNGLHIV